MYVFYFAITFRVVWSTINALNAEVVKYQTLVAHS